MMNASLANACSAFLIISSLARTIFAVPCNEKCANGGTVYRGNCNRNNGKCKCPYGWTGPDAHFTSNNTNHIEADHCTVECQYTHDHRNDACLLPAQVDSPPICHNDCGRYASKCIANSRCLCWHGWTGPNAEYITLTTNGIDSIRVAAEHCFIPCHYGSLASPNPLCLNH